MTLARQKGFSCQVLAEHSTRASHPQTANADDHHFSSLKLSAESSLCFLLIIRSVRPIGRRHDEAEC
jgi:hypothetical protein